MPGYSVSIKERMLYSSCKNAVVNVLENVYSIQIDKKIEVDSGSELTEEFLMVFISIYFLIFLTICFPGRGSSYQEFTQTKILKASTTEQRCKKNYKSSAILDKKDQTIFFT